MPALSDKVVSLLRTVVPVIWGSLIAWLLTVISLPASVTGFLTTRPTSSSSWPSPAGMRGSGGWSRACPHG